MSRKLLIRVMVVDDHQVVREGVISMLHAASEIEVVGQAANAPEAIQRARELKPDVVLLDIRLPAVGALEPLRALPDTLKHLEAGATASAMVFVQRHLPSSLGLPGPSQLVGSSFP